MEAPQLAFVVDGHEDPAIEIRVNFGVFAGRVATPAEIDALARSLLAEVEDVTIVAEDRHEIDAAVEAAVHQVRVEVAAADAPADGEARQELAARLCRRAEQWATACVAERHFDAADL
jgi:hypothetical protein